MDVRTLDDLVGDFAPGGKRIFVRVDFNVPLERDAAGAIVVADERRIAASLPTLRWLLERGAALIVASHVGRPEGRPDPALSMKPIADRLAALLGRPVGFVPSSIGETVLARSSRLQPGDVLVLENLRFHDGEEACDPELARALAAPAELYVNDAFGTCHRAHASVTGVPGILPGVAGRLVEVEVAAFKKAMHEPARPVVAILGGAKIGDKIGTIRHLRKLADHLLIGGGMACTFQRAQGLPVGASLVDIAALDVAREILAERDGAQLHLPTDWIIAKEISSSAPYQIVPLDEVADPWRALDIGPRTINEFVGLIKESATVLWNGPMGVFETPPFDRGTLEVAVAIAEHPCVSLVGGGDTARAAKKARVVDRLTHVSTGGGASLDMLSGIDLPGLAVLRGRLGA
ncbi:MAG: phosphoglycerate kinase [Candidatus Schekmanbacteria bacterium]|nr:phosphoglycerate kinase [Candidatus Schekmanbacteria bacterium]